jgi:hypothetical protein
MPIAVIHPLHSLFPSFRYLADLRIGFGRLPAPPGNTLSDNHISPPVSIHSGRRLCGGAKQTGLARVYNVVFTRSVKISPVKSSGQATSVKSFEISPLFLF